MTNKKITQKQVDGALKKCAEAREKWDEAMKKYWELKRRFEEQK